MSGSEIAAEVAEAIARAGAEVGNGTALTGTIIRTSGADESTYPPTLGSDNEYACTLIMMDYEDRDRDGTQITASDAKAMIAADAETDPRNGDKLRVLGKTFSVVNVVPEQPGGVVLYWMAQIRRA